VTILQWPKRFDAALGLMCRWRCMITHENCTQDQQLPKIEAKTKGLIDFIGLT
jgi:hypothetical protein